MMQMNWSGTAWGLQAWLLVELGKAKKGIKLIDFIKERKVLNER